MASTLQLFKKFYKGLGQGKHDFSSHTFKAMLTNVAPNISSNEQKSDITEISAGAGYSAGGVAITITSQGMNGGGDVYEVFFDPIIFTASGGTIGPFQWIVVYNDSSTGDLLVGYMDYTTAKSLFSSQTLTVTFGAAAVQIALN